MRNHNPRVTSLTFPSLKSHRDQFMRRRVREHQGIRARSRRNRRAHVLVHGVLVAGWISSVTA
jgi:hypothetical protein